MARSHTFRKFCIVHGKVYYNSCKHCKIYQLHVHNLSSTILSYTYFLTSRMAEAQEMDISRKRHLTSGSDDVRVVVQKMEEHINKCKPEYEKVHIRCEKSPQSLTPGGDTACQDSKPEDDLDLSVLFSQQHNADTVNNSCSLTVDSQSEDVDVSCDTGENTNEKMPKRTCEVIQDVNMEVGVVADTEMEDDVNDNVSMEARAADSVQRLKDVTAKIKVSRSIFEALKDMDDTFAARLAETGCDVQLPKKRKKPVTVFGVTEIDVQLACKLLKSGLAAEKAVRPLLTHFVSLRLTHAVQQERFAEFRERLRAVQPDQELLPDRLLQRPEKLHMSLSMLRLSDEAACQAARDALEDCCRQLRARPPLVFRLRGLGTFGSASRARVLFSRPEGAERLQAAAQLLHDQLSEAGLTARQQTGDTLHVTLLNTTFLTRGATRRHWRNFRGFDHRPIIERLGEFDFGEVCPEAFEISSLTKKAEDGYYTSIGRGLLHDSDIAQQEERSEQPSDGEKVQVVRSDPSSPLVKESELELPLETPVVALSSPSGDAPSAAGQLPADICLPAPVPGSQPAPETLLKRDDGPAAETA